MSNKATNKATYFFLVDNFWTLISSAYVILARMSNVLISQYIYSPYGPAEIIHSSKKKKKIITVRPLEFLTDLGNR